MTTINATLRSEVAEATVVAGMRTKTDSIIWFASAVGCSCIGKTPHEAARELIAYLEKNYGKSVHIIFH